MHTPRTSLVVGFVFVAVLHAAGQVTDRQSLLDKAIDQRALQAQQQREEAAERLTLFPMEGTIDPSVYVVGPSDVMQVGLWGPITFSYTLPVTPEGTLIIPTVGEVRISEMRLADARLHAIGAIRKKYLTGEISVTLVRPRSFIVTVRGSVPRPGQYIATAVDRAEKLLMQAAAVQYPTTSFTIPAFSPEDGLPNTVESVKTPRVDQALKWHESSSTRNIRLIRRSGDTLRVDIPRFHATGDERYNPFLLDGDLIVVPTRVQQKSSITLFGALNAPGIYEYGEGDNLLDAIQIAGGLLPTADSSAIVLSRPSADGSELLERTYNLDAIRAGREANPDLLPGDRVLVKERTMHKSAGVTIHGEVRQPGLYPIIDRSTRLSRLLDDAGGLTGHALLSGSILLRREDRIKDDVEPRLELLRNLRTHQLNLTDSTVYFLNLRVGRHPVVVDFRRLIEEHDTTQDVVLHDDDVIFIASDLHSVLVQGQVANSGYVSFAPGADYRHYIERAGGLSELADEGKIRVIKKGSLEWRDPMSTPIESGDQIWVPKKPRRELRYYFELIRDVASIVAAVGTTIILAIQVTR